MTDLSPDRLSLTIGTSLPEIDIGRLTCPDKKCHETNRSMDRENQVNNDFIDFLDDDDDDEYDDDRSRRLDNGKQEPKDESIKLPDAQQETRVHIGSHERPRGNENNVLEHNHHHRHYHDQKPDGRHVKEFIKPDPTVRRAVAARVSPKEGQKGSKEATGVADQDPVVFKAQPLRIVTAVDEEQLHQRLVESCSSGKQPLGQVRPKTPERKCRDRYCEVHKKQPTVSYKSDSSKSNSSSSSSANRIDQFKSPLPTTILIPPDVAKSLSQRSKDQEKLDPFINNRNISTNSPSHEDSRGSGKSLIYHPPNSKISREQLEYGPFLKQDEVQVLYRNPESADNVLGVSCS